MTLLGRAALVADLGRRGAVHHERLDASGYHRGSGGAQLSRAARVLAAGGVWTALRDNRSHRLALTPVRAFEVLPAEATAGRLDGGAVGAVLAATGQGGRRLSWPAGLSQREVQVLRLIARGRPTARSPGS